MSSDSRRHENLLIAMLVVTAFAYVTFQLQLSPLLPAIGQEFGKSESTVGQIQTIASLVTTFSALMLAAYMQRFSRRRWFRGMLLGMVAGGVIMAFSQSFAMLVAGRVIAALSSSLMLANSFTAAGELISDSRKRDRAISLIATGTTLGIMLGLPAISLVEEHAGWRTACLTAVLPLFVILAGTRWLPGTRPAAPSEHQSRIARYRVVLEHRPTVSLLLGTVLTFLGYFGWLTYFAAYVETEFGKGAGTLAVLFFIGGLAEAIANQFLPNLANRFSGWWMAITGGVGFGLTLLGFGTIFTTIGLLFLAVALLHVLSAYLYIGCSMLLVRAPAEWRGTAMALQAACSGFGGALGALVGGAVLAVTDDYNMTYWVLGLLALTSGLVLLWGKRAEEQETILTVPAS